MIKKFSIFNFQFLKKIGVGLPSTVKNGAGFTLIELLVVISIIGILAGLTLSSYSGAQKQARDSQRRSDLNQYRNALEVYAGANNLKYPGYTTRAVASTTLCSKLSAMMSSCPADPQATGVYNYRSDIGNAGDPTSTVFVLWVKMETGGCWEVCSGGKTGKITNPTITTCPDDGGGNGDVSGTCQL